jgi:hypothetical protein
MIEASAEISRDVMLAKASVKETTLIIIGVVWILLLVAFRYIFNRCCDKDVYAKIWPSVLVIS